MPYLLHLSESIREACSEFAPQMWNAMGAAHGSWRLRQDTLCVLTMIFFQLTHPSSVLQQMSSVLQSHPQTDRLFFFLYSEPLPHCRAQSWPMRLPLFPLNPVAVNWLSSSSHWAPPPGSGSRPAEHENQDCLDIKGWLWPPSDMEASSSDETKKSASGLHSTTQPTGGRAETESVSCRCSAQTNKGSMRRLKADYNKPMRKH